MDVFRASRDLPALGLFSTGYEIPYCIRHPLIIYKVGLLRNYIAPYSKNRVLLPSLVGITLLLTAKLKWIWLYKGACHARGLSWQPFRHFTHYYLWGYGCCRGTHFLQGWSLWEAGTYWDMIARRGYYHVCFGGGGALGRVWNGRQLISNVAFSLTFLQQVWSIDGASVCLRLNLFLGLCDTPSQRGW